MSTTIIKEEINHFAGRSSKWWAESGEYEILHKMNPARIAFIKDNALSHLESIKNKQILDIGCGGGILCEPLARIGGKITGIDADSSAINIARAHANKAGIKNINYLHSSVEELASDPKNKNAFDIITAMEIIEHIDNLDLFIKSCSQLLCENGMVFFSTLNRTPISYALGIFAAENILRIVPKGTHSWKKFIKPSELTETARSNNLKIHDIKGIIYNPMTKKFSLKSGRVEMNYVVCYVS